MKKSVFVPVVAAVLFALPGCKHKQEEQVAAPDKFVLSDTLAHMIHIDTAASETINDVLKLNGEVSFDENSVVKIFPNTSGVVQEVKVSFGDKVQKGQVLAIIKSADVAGTYNDLASAEADVKIAKRQMESTESLYKNGLSSEQEYEQAKQTYQKALSSKEKLSAVLSINGGGNMQPGGVFAIKSPSNGYVVERKVNAGNFIRPDMADNMFTVSDLKNVWVLANVFETDIPKVQQGYSAKVTTLAYPNKVFTGKVNNISDLLDPTNKALKVRISLPNEGLLLKPEMFANVLIDNKEGRKAIVVPSSALINDNGKTYVIVYKSKDDVQAREVNVVKTVGDKTYLNNGVEAGELLITKNQLLVYNALLGS